MKAISGFSKENLLRQMSDESWGATDMLEGLTQQELAERYVGAFVNAAVRRFPSKEVPLHIRRMRPVPRKKS